MTRKHTWVLVTFWFVAGDAMTMQARGPLLASFEAEFGLSERLLGLVAPAGTLGFVLAILVVGLLAGRVKVRRTLLVGVIGTMTALIAMATAPVYWLFLAALLIQGATMGVFRAVDRPLLSHLYPGRIGRIFSLYGFAWALGAVTGPVIVSTVLDVTGWRWTFLLMGCWFVPVVSALFHLDVPSGTWEEREIDVSALRRLLRRPPIRGTLAAMALLGGIEGTMFTWLPYYAGSFMDRSIANLALSVYLFGYVPGRLTYTWIVDRMAYLPLALATAAIATPVLAATAIWTTPERVLIAVFIAGFLVSALFPVISAYGVDTAPTYSGPISGMATASTYIGIATVPVAVGVIAEKTGIAIAMRLMVGIGIALCCSLAITYYGQRHRDST